MISIAMTTYNGERYLREQLDSILSQTVKDFELIVCDDCSTDGTWNILEEYKGKDKRISVFRNDGNLGFKKNFEKAISLCKREYVALSDQDDIWQTTHLETLLSIIGSKMLACGNANLIDGNGKKIGLTLAEMESLDALSSDGLSQAYTITYFRSAFQGASMLVKRDFLEKALPIPDGANFHDSWFALLSCFCGGMAYTFDVVNNYRFHGHNVTGNRTKRKSKIQDFLFQVIYSGMTYDREFLLQSIKERIDGLTEEEIEFIDGALARIKRAHSLLGRICNIPFRLINFKKIYSC